MVEEFARYATEIYRNFGIKATSRSEGSHAVLKRLLRNRLAHLEQLHTAIRTVYERIAMKFESKLQKQRDKKFLHLEGIKLFRQLHYHVSFFAITKIEEQYLLAKRIFDRSPNDMIPHCRDAFTSQFGLPC